MRWGEPLRWCDRFYFETDATFGTVFSMAKSVMAVARKVGEVKLWEKPVDTASLALATLLAHPGESVWTGPNRVASTEKPGAYATKKCAQFGFHHYILCRLAMAKEPKQAQNRFSLTPESARHPFGVSPRDL